MALDTAQAPGTGVKKRPAGGRPTGKAGATASPAVKMAPFARIVRDVAHDLSPGKKFTQEALVVLKGAAELFLVESLCDANVARVHAKRATLYAVDMHLTRSLRSKAERAYAYEGPAGVVADP